ncbi:MAG TPA: hypothetical protein VIJ12_07395 [Candidatus Baltobacteraceae bacterium]
MASRKRFVALAAASVSALIAAPALGQTTAAPAPAPSPSPSVASMSRVSDAARALALQMRGFDPNLTDGEVDAIAHGIDGNLKIGAAINRKGRVLKNWNEPVTRFEVQK